MKKILLIFLLSNSFAQDKPKSNFKEFDVEVLNNSLICKTISDDNFIDLDTFHINVGKKISLKGKNYYHFYFGLKDSLEGYIRHENGIIYYLPLNFLNESVLFDFNHKLKKNLVRNFGKYKISMFSTQIRQSKFNQVSGNIYYQFSFEYLCCENILKIKELGLSLKHGIDNIQISTPNRKYSIMQCRQN